VASAPKMTSFLHLSSHQNPFQHGRLPFSDAPRNFLFIPCAN
jgi:hypothetical protein